MTSETLINRLHLQAAERLKEKVREGRRRALSSISRCCVVVTDDGMTTQELIFDQPPTLRELAEHVEPDQWVVAVQMRRRARTARQRRVLAAE